MQSNHWLPLTEYALRSGLSISTLRRKIKSNAIEYRMEDGRYLIRSDEMVDEAPESKKSTFAFTSSDEVPATKKSASVARALTPIPSMPSLPSAKVLRATSDELEAIRQEVKLGRAEDALRWRALEARVSGIARKLDLFSEQISELKMLVKIFEEKLDARL
jgi:hypothetical protein